MRIVALATVIAYLLLLLVPCPAPACSLCGSYAVKFPFVTDYWHAHAVVCGTLANPRLNGTTGAGTTELVIDKVLKGDARLQGVKSVTLPRYFTVLNPSDPPRFIALFDEKMLFFTGRTDFTPALLDFLLASDAVKGKPRTEALVHFAKYLDSKDRTVADEAFLLFAQANDKEVMEVAAHLKPDVFRKLVKDAKVESERLSLFAFLLGATGGPADVDLLAPYLKKPDERSAKALEGILAGYILRRPKDGWGWAYGVLGNPRQPFMLRWGAVRAVRFLHNVRPTEYRAQVAHALGLMVPHGELADVAIVDLQKWQLWDHTDVILKQYGRPTHSAPIIRNAILRYAMACPQPVARQFIAERRRLEPQVVRDLEDDLAFEKGK
jgi:hypothetical protein